jgi:hypothetical protein
MKTCIEIISENKNFNEDKFLELLKYKASFKRGFKSKVFKDYKNIIPLSLNDIPNQPIFFFKKKI